MPGPNQRERRALATAIWQWVTRNLSDLPEMTTPRGAPSREWRQWWDEHEARFSAGEHTLVRLGYWAVNGREPVELAELHGLDNTWAPLAGEAIRLCLEPRFDTPRYDLLLRKIYRLTKEAGR